MAIFNFYLAWCWLLVGLLTGIVAGLKFHGADWLGGYGAWPRRLMRLGHISFFGTGFLNLAFAGSVMMVNGHGLEVRVASILLAIGAIAMPVVCYLSAWRSSWRYAFVVPVSGLTLGTGLYFLSLMREVFSGR